MVLDGSSSILPVSAPHQDLNLLVPAAVRGPTLDMTTALTQVASQTNPYQTRPSH